MFDETNIFALLKEKYVLPKKVKLFEAFSGIGCQRLAFNRLGIEVEMVGISEIDKYAIQSYNAIHGETKNFGSITDIHGKDLPEIDVFTYSFPCTDLSKAGKQKGLNETRSGLVYEVLRILHELEIEKRLPKVLIMENVVDLIQVKFIKQFQEIQLELERLGYSNYTETMNAKDYGVAQNRDRVFMVSILGDYYYEFPKPFKLEKRLKDYLEYKVEERYYLTETSLAGLNQALERHGQDIDKITDNGKELNVIQYPRGENHGGLISDITSPTVDGAIGARNTALLCVKEKVYEGAVDEKYYLSEKALANNLDMTDRNGFVRGERFTPHTVDDEYAFAIKTLEGNRVKDNYIQEPTICDFRYDEGFRSREEDDISPTLPSTHLGTSLLSGQPFVREPYIVDDTYKNRDERVYENCSPTIRSEREGLKVVEPSIIVKENNSTGYDVAIEGDCININQPNSKTRMGRVGHQVSQTLTTQQELVVVEYGNYYTWEDKQGNINTQCNMAADEEKYALTVACAESGNVYENKLRIRKLTPRETGRLMGLTDEEISKQLSVVSNSQAYKQHGNGIVVDVFAAILNQMKGE